MMIRCYHLYKPSYTLHLQHDGDDEALLVTIHDAAMATIEPRCWHSPKSSPHDTADGYFVACIERNFVRRAFGEAYEYEVLCIGRKLLQQSGVVTKNNRSA